MLFKLFTLFKLSQMCPVCGNKAHKDMKDCPAFEDSADELRRKEGRPFDYGKKLPDGQHERHPSLANPKPKQQVRYVYKHLTCKTTTRMPEHCALTYATNPKYYSGTFCSHCRDYFPVGQFVWPEDGKPIGEPI